LREKCLVQVFGFLCDLCVLCVLCVKVGREEIFNAGGAEDAEIAEKDSNSLRGAGDE
jgi:hypothetical protein